MVLKIVWLRPAHARVRQLFSIMGDEQGTKEQSSQTIGLNFYLELSRQFFLFFHFLMIQFY